MKNLISTCVVTISLGLSSTLGVISQENNEKSSEILAAGMVKVVQHRLIVASNPTLGYDNEQIDQILSEMTQIANKSWFHWDKSCSPIEFIRSGDLILSNDIPSSGEHDYIISRAKVAAPKANAVLVLQLDCGVVQGAAGCGQLGREPEVVIPYPGYEGTLWLHERGHNMGLDHAPGEGAEEHTQPEEVAKRFMFWRLGTRHYGKTSQECEVMNKVGKFSSVAYVAKKPLIIPATAAAAELETKYGLTTAAYQLIGPPWLHGIEPVEQINTLNEEDINSIRNMLRGNINETWPNALKVLARRGNAKDAELFERAIRFPVAALPEKPTKQQSDQVRNLLRAKLVAPESLGDLARKTQDSSVVDTLTAATRTEKLGTGTNSSLANEIAAQAVTGLAKANTADAKNKVGEIIDAQANKSPNEVPMIMGEPIAKLNRPQIDRIMNIQKSMQ